MKKTLMIAAAAAALAAGAAATIAAPAETGAKAEAGLKADVRVGSSGQAQNGCVTKTNKVKITYWDGWNWSHKWIVKPVTFCL